MGGSFSVSTSNSYISGTVQWSEGNVNTTNNTSDVTATMYLSRTNTGYTSSGSDTFYVTINGTKVSNTLSYDLTYNSDTQMVTGTVTVPHNSDGTMSCTIGWGGGGGGGGVFTVTSGSGTANLSTIARASTISSNVYWTAGTQNLGVSLSAYDSTYHHTLTLETKNSSGAWTIVATRTNVGSSTTMVFTQSEITKMYSWMGTDSYSSATLYVDTYDSSGNHIGSQTSKSGSCYAATPSKPTMSAFNNGTIPTISLTPPNSSFTQTITWSLMNYNCTVASGVTSSSYNWDTTTIDSANGLSFADNMYKQMANTNSSWGTLTVTTYYNGQQVQGAQQTTPYIYIINSNPAFTGSFTYKDTSSTVVGITGNNQAIVQNQSILEVDLPSSAQATGVHYATMSYYLAKIGSTSVKMNVPGSAPSLSLSANSGSTITAGTYYVKFTWVDSSGNESLPSPEASISVTSGNNLVITIPSRPTGVSTANIYVSTATGTEKKQGGTSGTSYTLSANPTTNGVAVPTTMAFKIGKLNISSNATLSVQAVDSRGNSTTAYSTVTIVPYSSPAISATAKRENGFNDATDLAISGTFSVCNVTTSGTTTAKNTIQSVQYQYKQLPSGSYNANSSLTPTVTNNTFSTPGATVTLTNIYAWQVLITVADKFASYQVTLTVPVGQPIVFIDATMNSIGIGQFPSHNNSLEVNGTIYEGGTALQPKYRPTGEITLWPTSTAPAGWILCDGSYISRTTYANLFAVIGTQYNLASDTDSTKFRLPGFAGRVPVGFYTGDSDFATLGNYGGEKTHTLTTAEMPVHSHQITTNSGLYFEGGSSGHADGTTGYATQASTLNTGNAGSGNAHNNMPPYTVINYIIKT